MHKRNATLLVGNAWKNTCLKFFYRGGGGDSGEVLLVLWTVLYTYKSKAASRESAHLDVCESRRNIVFFCLRWGIVIHLELRTLSASVRARARGQTV